MLSGRRCGGTRVMSASASRTRPSLGRSKPATMRSSVVLPQPEGPSIVTNSPSRIARLTSSSATTAPKRWVTRSTVTAAACSLTAARPRRRRRARAERRRAPRSANTNASSHSRSVTAISSVETTLIDGSTVRRSCDQMYSGSVPSGADHEERDDELVERERERQAGRADQQRPDLRHRHAPEAQPAVRAEIGRGLVERGVEAVERGRRDQQEVREHVDACGR